MLCAIVLFIRRELTAEKAAGDEKDDPSHSSQPCKGQDCVAGIFSRRPLVSALGFPIMVCAVSAARSWS